MNIEMMIEKFKKVSKENQQTLAKRTGRKLKTNRKGIVGGK